MTGFNVFDLVGLDEDASSYEIDLKIKEIKDRSSRYKDKNIFEKIIKALEIYKKRALEREKLEELAKEAPRRNISLSKETEEALEYFSTDKTVEPKEKKKKSYKLQKAVITVGVIAILFSAGNKIIDNIKEKDYQNNVCIEYTVQSGDSFGWVDDNIRDYSTIRTQNVGANFRYDYLYKGDLIIGRTTMEKAKELEEKGYARIISIEEAIDIIETSGGRLHGKLDDYKENDINDEAFVFFDPSMVHTI